MPKNQSLLSKKEQSGRRQMTNFIKENIKA